MKSLKIAIMQSNPIVGDVHQNTTNLLNTFQNTCDFDILVTSECYISGYPIEDLVQRSEFLKTVEEEVERIRQATAGNDKAILVGSPIQIKNKVYNGAYFISNGEIQYRLKHHRPNYGPFDEKRIFSYASLEEQLPIQYKNFNIGVMICEDIWYSDVANYLKSKQVDLFLSLHGSPYHIAKWKEREKIAQAIVSQTRTPLVYVNQVGGQDELVFDGGSFVIAPNPYTGFFEDGPGSYITRWLPQFKEVTKVFTITTGRLGDLLHENNNHPNLSEIEEIRQALVLGIRDYVNKNKFPGVVIGLSGGIDSAVTAAIAVDALGPDRVTGILMPGPFSSNHSVTDAEKLGENLGIRTLNIPISPIFDSWKETVEPLVNHKKNSVTHENAQARIRGGLILMAFSNETGYMVLSTGNKSEMSVGYATLYGDMNGGFNALKDLYKTTVFELARHYNSSKEIIPWNTINKPPSAELAEDQKDEDSLPPYDILDGILRGLIEEELRISTISIRLDVEKNLVQKIQNMLYSAEFKRRQAPPGTKITKKSLGRDRRYPIINRYRD